MDCNKQFKTIARGTTPTITVTFSTIDVSTIVAAYLTFKQGGQSIFEMPLSDATVGEGMISWMVPQEDTLLLAENKFVDVIVDWKTSDGVRGQSKPASYKVTPAGVDEVI